MFKKAISILTAILIVSSFTFTGCGKEAVNNSQGSSQAATKSEATEETTKPAEPVKLKILATDSPDADSSYANNPPVLQELQKRTNVTIEWELATGTNLTTLVETRLAAGMNLPDIMQTGLLGTERFANLGKQGIIIPLGDLIDKNAPNIKKAFWETFPEISKLNTSPDGKIYYIGSLIANLQGRFTTLNIRQDWLDSLGIKSPETVDELYQALKAMRDKDANKNQKKDEVATQSGPGAFAFFNNLPQAFGVKRLEADSSISWYADSNGKVYNTIITNETKEYLTWMQKLFKEGIIDNEIFSTSWEKFNSKLATNQVSAVGNAMWACWYGQVADGKGVKGVKFVPLKPLAGPKGDGGIYMNNYNYGGAWVITRDCKNPEAAIKLLDYCISPEGSKLLYFGYEGVDWVKSTIAGAGEYDADYTPQFQTNMKNDPKYNLKQGQNCLALPIVLVNSDEYVINDLNKNFGNNGADPAILKAFVENLHKLEIKAYVEAVPTEQESKELNAISKDLWLYMNEMISKFIMGNESMDKWDGFVKKCNDLGLQKAVEIHQRMYDRYVNMK